jgi:23S rRNA-/tRNA-specific pseudouridylate synthase
MRRHVVSEPELRVLFRDADWLAVEKPSGIPTTAPPSAGVTSLVDRVRALDGTSLAHPLSRLDVEVTGVVLFASTAEALARARAEREAGRYRRRYLALLAATPDPPCGEWIWAIDVDPRDRRLRRAGDAGQPARTRYAVSAVALGRARVEFDLDTGRTHQIRVHAKKAGCPVLGDRAYGGPRHLTLNDGGVITARRLMLHALRVVVPGSHRAVECAPPADFEAVWSALVAHR